MLNAVYKNNYKYIMPIEKEKIIKSDVWYMLAYLQSWSVAKVAFSFTAVNMVIEYGYQAELCV